MAVLGGGKRAVADNKIHFTMRSGDSFLLLWLRVCLCKSCFKQAFFTCVPPPPPPQSPSCFARVQMCRPKLFCFEKDRLRGELSCNTRWMNHMCFFGSRCSSRHRTIGCGPILGIGLEPNFCNPPTHPGEVDTRYRVPSVEEGGCTGCSVLRFPPTSCEPTLERRSKP